MKHATRRALEKWIVPALVGGVFGGFAGGLLALDRPETAISLVFVAGIVAVAMTAWDYWRSDEMERRIYHAAMTCAFFGATVIVLLAGLAQLHGAPVPNWGWAAGVMLGFYVAGWWASWLRHR